MVMRLVRDDEDGREPRPRARVIALSRARGTGPRLVRDSVTTPAGDVETVEGTMASEVSEEVEELSPPAHAAGEADADGNADRQAERPAERAADREGERPDGTVEQNADADDAEGSDAAASEAVEVNLGAMEALLLSTHHPLTAGRLAELLDLEAIKPVRKAIQQL